MCVYCNRSQKTSQRVKNNSHATRLRLVSYFFVLYTLWHHLSSITVHTAHGKMLSICQLTPVHVGLTRKTNYPLSRATGANFPIFLWFWKSHKNIKHGYTEYGPKSSILIMHVGIILAQYRYWVFLILYWPSLKINYYYYKHTFY